jgi:capsular polysaccharide biosynthesis protein
MNNDINLGYLFKIFKNNWLKIAAITIAVTVAMALLTVFLLPKKYECEMEFYILNASDAEYTSTSVVGASAYLANDYIAIINSDIMLNKVSEKLETEHSLKYTPDDIRDMISSKTKSSTSTFNISIKTADPNTSYWIASYIAEFAPDIVSDITSKYVETAETELKSNEPLRVLQFPEFSENHSSPSLIINCFLACFIAAAVSYTAFFLSDLLDTTIHSEENVKEKIAYPLIGTIPDWKISAGTKKE